MKIETAEQLLEHIIQDLYSDEQQLVVALPKAAKASANPQLKEGFEMHLEETKMQVKRLEEAGKTLGLKITGVKCAAMEGLVKEVSENIEEVIEGELRDAVVLAGAMAIENYEIIKYKMLIMMLEPDNKDVADLLRETLKEEEAAAKKLTSLIPS